MRLARAEKVLLESENKLSEMTSELQGTVCVVVMTFDSKVFDLVNFEESTVLSWLKSEQSLCMSRQGKYIIIMKYHEAFLCG